MDFRGQNSTHTKNLLSYHVIIMITMNNVLIVESHRGREDSLTRKLGKTVQRRGPWK